MLRRWTMDDARFDSLIRALTAAGCAPSSEPDPPRASLRSAATATPPEAAAKKKCPPCESASRTSARASNPMGRRARVGSAGAGSVSPRRRRLPPRHPKLHRGKVCTAASVCACPAGDLAAAGHAGSAAPAPLHRGRDLNASGVSVVPGQPKSTAGPWYVNRQLLLRNWFCGRSESVLPLPHQRRRGHLPVWNILGGGGLRRTSLLQHVLQDGCLQLPAGGRLTKSRPAPGRAEWPSGEQRAHLLSHPLVKIPSGGVPLLTRRRGRRGVGEKNPPGLKVASASSGVSANVIARVTVQRAETPDLSDRQWGRLRSSLLPP